MTGTVRTITQTRVSHHSEPARPRAQCGTEAGAGGRSLLEAPGPWAGTAEHAATAAVAGAPSSRRARGPPWPAARPRLPGSSRSLPRGGSGPAPRPPLSSASAPCARGPRAEEQPSGVSPRLAQLPGEPGALGVWTHMPLEMATSWNSRSMAPGKRVKAQPESLSLTRPSPLSLKAALRGSHVSCQERGRGKCPALPPLCSWSGGHCPRERRTLPTGSGSELGSAKEYAKLAYRTRV
ncbi:uncharacterized protein LOC144376881 [Ictidomys tridecemlineatus]